MTAKGFLMKILVPADGSASSLMAQETTITVAKKTGAKVTIMHVMPELRIVYRLPHNVEEEMVEAAEQKAEEITNEAQALFFQEKITTDKQIIRRTDPADAILELSCDYDLTVMGAHGENEKDPYALGSVTKKVIAHTECPTLIVKKVSNLYNLLVCVDGSKSAIKALDYGVKLAEKMNADITLLNVQENRLFDTSPKFAQDLGDKILSNALDAIENRKLKVDKKMAFGVPSNVIVEVAEKGKHDLIVLGSRGQGKVKRFLLGSVCDDVSHKAKCSVLIVPAKTRTAS
jgi:nucleotide-binding universal stress UspA family protein